MKTNRIRVRVNQDHYHLGSIVFSGGEIHVDINHLPSSCDDYSVKARLQSSEDIMHFVMLCDALDRRYPSAESSVIIPYFPYARQDRMCSPGQHFGAAVIAKIIGGIPQRHLTVYDLHSPVTRDLLEVHFGVTEITQGDILMPTKVGNLIGEGKLRIVSPDKGATQKALEVRNVCNGPLPVLQCGKTRDPATGKINGFAVDEEDLAGQDLIIVDDICDAGGTFLGLAAELRKRGAKSVDLYVTHGIFSKGFDAFSGLIDNIYATDSFRREGPTNGEVAPGVFLHQIKV